MATVPTVPVEEAGTISTSADWNAWCSTLTYLLGSGSGKNPMFFLMSSATQAWTTTPAFCNFSNTAAVFKDNDGGFSSGNPGRYTIQTPGYWHVDYAVNGGSAASNLVTFLQITTTASNTFNPSATIKCQYTNAPQTTSAAFNQSGGLLPIPLFAGDILQIVVSTGASSTEGTSPFSHFTGMWVSA
jgi:hypothetical protein